MTQQKSDWLDWSLNRLIAYGANPQEALSSEELEELESFDPTVQFNEIGEEINPMSPEQKAAQDKLMAALAQANERYYATQPQQE
jgi:hypothetical protein